ncbi:hypothetical protein AC249_AIPGENE23436 [Exaiptasia diaphana]|nr:hypothetical protein AC249_AIPGENE23436 [Exaiptasia diaphana]
MDGDIAFNENVLDCEIISPELLNVIPSSAKEIRGYHLVEFRGDVLWKWRSLKHAHPYNYFNILNKSLAQLGYGISANSSNNLGVTLRTKTYRFVQRVKGMSTKSRKKAITESWFQLKVWEEQMVQIPKQVIKQQDEERESMERELEETHAKVYEILQENWEIKRENEDLKIGAADLMNQGKHVSEVQLRQKARKMSGNHTIAVVQTSEDYDTLKVSLSNVIKDVNDLEREGYIDVDGTKLKLDLFLGGDYKADNFGIPKVHQKTKHLNDLISAIQSCGVGFRVWINNENKLDWTSLMGGDKKKLLKNLPSKFKDFVRTSEIEKVTKLWKDFGKIYDVLTSISPHEDDIKGFHEMAKNWASQLLNLKSVRSINRWDACKSLIVIDKRLEVLSENKRKKRQYTKRNLSFWEDGGKATVVHNYPRVSIPTKETNTEDMQPPDENTEVSHPTYTEDQLQKQTVVQLRHILKDLSEEPISKRARKSAF